MAEPKIGDKYLYSGNGRGGQSILGTKGIGTVTHVDKSKDWVTLRLDVSGFMITMNRDVFGKRCTLLMEAGKNAEKD